MAKKSIIYVPAKSTAQAAAEFPKQVPVRYWKLNKVRKAKETEFPYKRTHGYSTYALEIESKLDTKKKCVAANGKWDARKKVCD